MNAFMYRIVPFLIAMVVGEFIYYKLDQSYQLTEKMYQKLHIRRENFGTICVCVSLLIILLFGILGVYVPLFPTIVYMVLSGILTGFAIAIQRAVR